MSRTSWAGNRPQSNSQAESRICDAALECYKRLGIARTTMTDVARQVGITRPTLYKYFKNKSALLFAAVDREAFAFAQSVVAHARTYATVEERVVETIVFVVREFPKTPHLSLVLGEDSGALLRARAFSDEATSVFSQMTAEPLVELRPDLAESGLEITEVMSRFALSMILFPGRYLIDHDGLRKLIRRRLVPGLIGT